MLSEGLFGVETEFAFTQFDKNGKAMPREHGLERMLHVARTRLESLPDCAVPGQSIILLREAEPMSEERRFVGSAVPRTATPPIGRPSSFARAIGYSI